MSFEQQYFFIGLFFVVGLIFAILPIAINRIIGPRKPNPVKNMPYECGVEKTGDAWVQFRVQYYVYALVFLIFDVEVAVVLPWAVVFKKLGLLGFIEMVIFLGILAVGLAYVWRKRDIEWA